MVDETISIDDRILSALLNHRECVVSAKEIDKIPSEYFDTEEQRKMYRNIMTVFANSNGRVMCSPEIVKASAEKQKKSGIEIARLFALYNSIKTIGTSVNEYAFYVNALKERWYKRLLTVSVKKANVLCNENDSPVEAAQELLKTSAQIKMLSSNDRIVRTTLSDRAKSLIERYEFAKNRKDEAMGLYTGFYKLDELTWGIQPGEVLIVAGPTGGGKSVTLVAMASYIYNGLSYCAKCGFQLFRHSQICPACGSDTTKDGAVYRIPGKNVAYVSIEMPEEDCMRRFVSSSLGLRSKDIQRGMLSPSDEKLYYDYMSHVESNKSASLHMIDVPRGVDADFIDAELDRIEATNGIKLDVVIIDYMQLMTSKASGHKEGDWKEQDSIAAEVHELARSRKIPAISAVQTTSVRNIKNEQMKYGTHRVARAEGIANNVNIIIQIEDVIDAEKEQSEKPTEETLAITYHVIKNRDGAKGVIRMQKDFSRMQIYHMVEYEYAKTE